jgi:shikimate dehydrogenase
MLNTFSGATRLYPIVGDPIAQVKSPYGITQAFEERGADAICVPMHVTPSDWNAFMTTMRAMKNVDGIIVTVPHKFAACTSCDTVSERAAFLKSVNTMRRMPDGGFHGDMFDGIGFVAACQDNGCDFDGKRALLVGTGGAGTAIAHAAVKAGLSQLGLCDLDEARRDDLVRRLTGLGATIVASSNDATPYDIILNASPIGMFPSVALPIKTGTLRAGHFVGDVVTKPEVPPLIAEAKKLGLRTSNGAAMFAKVRDLIVAYLLQPEDQGMREP